MLGIRHYQQVAIDLWLGDAREFVCDTFVLCCKAAQAKGLYPLGSSEAALYPASSAHRLCYDDFATLVHLWRQHLRTLAHLGRHLAASLSSEPPLELATSFFVALQADLGQGLGSSKLGRISILCADLQTYQLWQKALFAIFTER